MHFIPMDPELVRKAIEGYDNELSGEKIKQDAFYRQFRCLNCRAECQREVVPGHAFTEGELLARSVLRCKRCGLVFDPHSGLVLEPPAV